MEELNPQQRPANPRRRRKTKLQIFKEAYLPVIIAGAAVLFILITFIGSAVRGINNKKLAQEESIAASELQAMLDAQLQQQETQLLAQAQVLAAGYDYDGAVALLDTFEGDMSKYPNMLEARDRYILAKSQLIPWEDPSQIPNLSLQMLIADPQKAFQDSKYAYSFTRNFLTVEEFPRILERLYAAGYILVNISDVYGTELAEDGSEVYVAKTIYLPSGKRPLILTQTNVNYHTYLTDGDGDKLPDAGGRGFANKLIIDSNGELTCEYVDASGQTLTGAYDMIPILNAFIKAHPDFSYHGAKAVIALTGYDGLFGYRTTEAAGNHFGADYRDQQIAQAQNIAQKLVNDGYELACYTYENVAYGGYSTTQLQTDLNGWITEVQPVLENISIFAFAQNSDIGPENTLYNDERFTALSDAGFRIFLGFCESGTNWSVICDTYVRQGRILLNPANIKYHPDWFGGILDAGAVLDPSRGEIPQ